MRLLIAGSGQLARMIALAAKPLGIDCVFVSEPGEDTSAVVGLGDLIAWAPGRDVAAELSVSIDAVTTEKEKVAPALIQQLAVVAPFRPAPAALRICQDRALEKQFLVESGIATSPFAIAQSAEDLDGALSGLRFPVVLKSCRTGYDGKHQWRLRTREDLTAVSAELVFPLIAEEFVVFSRELSINVVRDTHGRAYFYPLMENTHRDGILVTTTAPAAADDQTSAAAIDIASRIVSALDYVGSLTAELFDTEQGLMVNELAPRPHNSGHWTMRGTPVCQFENHVRAVLGLPVAAPRVIEPVAMINVLGRLPALAQLLTDDVQVHLYQKSERPGRKLGHLLITGDPAELPQLAQQWLHRIESQSRS
jgi:5-(carboxyamino)imidazole ribonucleotide synthase